MVLLTALAPFPSPLSFPAPSRLEAGGLILHSFSLCEIRRFFLSFHSLFFCCVLLLAFAFAFVMAHVMKRVAHIETTLSHKSLVSGRVSLAADFIDFLHAPCGNV